MADKVENKLVGIETLKSFTSPEELEVWELLVKVHDKFVKLPDKHPLCYVRMDISYARSPISNGA